MSLEWEQVVIDSRDHRVLGRWWAGMLGWVVVNDEPDEFEIRPSPEQLPGLLFGPVTDSKVVKNRLHLDFRPADQQAEVQRFLQAGATRVNVGQGDVPWVVLADPEGNEFCILSARRPATGS
jgi:predicted enzyme related to lactoylglutathione lyase